MWKRGSVVDVVGDLYPLESKWNDEKSPTASNTNQTECKFTHMTKDSNNSNMFKEVPNTLGKDDATPIEPKVIEQAKQTLCKSFPDQYQC